MKYQPFAILTFFLILGIVVGDCYNFNLMNLLVLGSFLLLVLIIFLFTKKLTLFYSIISFLLIAVLGIIRIEQNKYKNPPTLSYEKQLLQLRISSNYKPSNKFHKYKAQVTKSEDSTLIDKYFLLYVRNNQKLLNIKDEILIHEKVDEISPPKNPHQFNYKRYMAKKGVTHQVFTDTILYAEPPPNVSIFHELSKIKQKIKSKLSNSKYSDASRIFISSLALGDRTDMTKETQKSLSSAGVMHLFAISGLHIGILFWVFTKLLFPLLYLPHGRSIRLLFALSFIWIFALFVDFTPSVTRAAFMITFYYFSYLLKRPANIFHTLFFTAFVLLIINPNQIYDVGFQLSYSAVFFIAWLYKPLRNLFPKYRKPKYNYFINIICLTTVAQLGVLPVSIYYFNQITGLFLIGNLLMIPISVLFVCLSMTMAILIAIGKDGPYIIYITNLIFDKTLELIEYISSFDSLIFKQISISGLQVFLLLGISFFFRFILIKFRWYKTIPILALFLLFQISRVYNHTIYESKKELIIFNEYKGNMIGIRNGDKLSIFYDVDDFEKTANYVLRPYIINEHIDSVTYYDIYASINSDYFIKQNNLIKFNGESLYITEKPIDSLPDVDYVIATKGRINGKTYISNNIKRVIADGSNYPNVVLDLKNNSERVYSTRENGAFILTVAPKVP